MATLGATAAQALLADSMLQGDVNMPGLIAGFFSATNLNQIIAGLPPLGGGLNLRQFYAVVRATANIKAWTPAYPDASKIRDINNAIGYLNGYTNATENPTSPDSRVPTIGKPIGAAQMLIQALGSMTLP
jgi:hypothetical protein